MTEEGAEAPVEEGAGERIGAVGGWREGEDKRWDARGRAIAVVEAALDGWAERGGWGGKEAAEEAGVEGAEAGRWRREERR